MKEADRKYDLAGYKIAGDAMEMRLLNTKVVPKTGGAGAHEGLTSVS